MRVEVLGLGFDNLTMDEAVERGLELMRRRDGGYVVTPNPEIAMACRKDPELRGIIEGAALVLPDGIGVVYGAKILGRPLKCKVAGADFAQGLFDVMAREGRSVFLLGAKPGVAEEAGRNLMSAHPGLVVSGTADGYFKDDGPIIERINALQPDLLLVCLGAPKQERWMSKNRDKLKVGLMAGLGGSLDVYAGAVQRAPESWQRHNVEWLYRLIQEPSRFGRMTQLPVFLVCVVGEKIGEKLKGK